MGQNTLTRSIEIKFNDVTPSLDAAYGLEFSVALYIKCLGQWIEEWTSGMLVQYSDVDPGVVYSSPVGLDPHTKWYVMVTPFGNEHCHLFGSHNNCKVSSPAEGGNYGWTETKSVVTIPWGVEAAS